MHRQKISQSHLFWRFLGGPSRPIAPPDRVYFSGTNKSTLPSSFGSTVKSPHFSASRFNTRFPTARGSPGPGHRRFISVFMPVLASQVIYNGMYSNKSRSLVAQGIFQLRENQPDGARDVRVPPVGVEGRFHHPQRVRGHNPQVFRPYPHPAVDEEVDAASHCPPPRRPIEFQFFAAVLSALSIAVQIGPPQNPSMAYMAPPPNYPSYNTPSPSYSPSSPVLSVSPPTPPGIEDSCIDVRSMGDPHVLYTSPGLSPDDYADPFNQASSQEQSHSWPTHLHSSVVNSTTTISTTGVY